MDFDLTEDQREIKGVARELLSARSTMARVREAAEGDGNDLALYDEMVQLGWPGIAVSEEHGGQGLGAVEPWRCCSRSSATPARPRRFCPPPWRRP